MEILQCIILIFAVFYVEAKYLNVDYQYDEDAKVWLKLHKIKTTWHEARKMCNLEGAVLASPLDELIKDSLDNYAKAHGINRIHIGIHSTFSSKIWHSIEGIPLQMMDHLGVGQLENPGQYCGVLENGLMVSGSFQNKLPYICYKRDNGGQELTSCGTFDKGYVLDERTGSCYKFHTEGKPWVEAYKTCFAEQAYLAIINSNAEVQVLKEIFAKHPNYTIKSRQPDVMSIGIVDWEHNRVWYTIHGEPLEDSGYSSWERGEPNYAGGNENCGNVNRMGYLNDDPCYKERAFICEKDVRFMQTNTTADQMPNEYHYTTTSLPSDNLYMTQSQQSDSLYTTPSQQSDSLYTTPSQHSDSLYTTPSQQSDSLYMTPSQHSDSLYTTTSQHSDSLYTTPSQQSDSLYTTPSQHSDSLYTTPSQQSDSLYTTPSQQSDSLYTTPSQHSDSLYTTPSQQSDSLYTTPSQHSDSLYTTPSQHSDSLYTTPSQQSDSLYTTPSQHSDSLYTTPSQQSDSLYTTPSQQSDSLFTTPSQQSDSLYATPSQHSDSLF